MTFFTIIMVLILGAALLILGFITKKRWIKILSIVPLAISIIQLLMLLSM